MAFVYSSVLLTAVLVFIVVGLHLFAARNKANILLVRNLTTVQIGLAQVQRTLPG